MDTKNQSEFDEAYDPLISKSRFNYGEALVVLNMVVQLTNAGVLQEDICIITPYALQVQVIQCALNENFPAVEVHSVDGYQGRENEVVILSLVRCNDRESIGFLDDERRLNVSVSRAKRLLAVVGNVETLKTNSFFKTLIEYLEESAVCLPVSTFMERTFELILEPANNDFNNDFNSLSLNESTSSTTSEDEQEDKLDDSILT